MRITLLRTTTIARGLVSLALVASTGSIVVFADTPGRLRQVPAGGCYCQCADSQRSSGCVKMCELPKYASRWWATTCAKPRNTPSANAPGAGPRLPHPGRAERAQL